MKKHFLLLITLFAVSLFALAEMTIYVYKKDGTKVPYVASAVDSIGFVNAHSIIFNANGGVGRMDVVRVKEGESITLPVNSFTKGEAKFVGWNTQTDGSGTTYVDKATVKPTANMTLYAQWEVPTTGTENGHEWVDLGLPSGTKWATMNVGADSPEDYGDYFAWGETTTKSDYNLSTYKWCEGSGDTMTRYCASSSYGTVDNIRTLYLSDDAAYVNWGTSWRMPTDEELKELQTNCTWTWITQNGVSGRKVTSKVNGNSIFLPAAGYRYDSGLKQVGYGRYWSSSRGLSDSDHASCLEFDSGDVYRDISTRYRGRSVRPVMRE